MQVYVKAWFSLVFFKFMSCICQSQTSQYTDNSGTVNYSVSSMKIHSGVVTGTDLQMLFSDQCRIQLSYFAARYNM